MLERPSEERAALIGRLHAREDARWLAELLIDVEEDPVVGVQLSEGLRTALS